MRVFSPACKGQHFKIKSADVLPLALEIGLAASFALPILQLSLCHFFVFRQITNHVTIYYKCKTATDLMLLVTDRKRQSDRACVCLC